jgi:acyl carrier protein
MSIDLLKKVFAESLGLDPDVNWDTLRYRGVEEWDSVAHMQLVGEIEDAFDVMLETQEVIGMSSFAETARILRGHGVDLD